MVGGTGFIVGVASEVAGRSFAYLVTNWHVAVRDGCSTVRLNRSSESPSIFTPEWHFLPGYDIAVAALMGLPEDHDYRIIPTWMFLKQEMKEKEQVGPGDDVFMIGRFVSHQVEGQSSVAARFGNISIDPTPMEHSGGFVVDTYCIDMHSRSGFSGSPVFVYRTPGYDLEDQLAASLPESKILFSGVNLFRLLGIHCGQFPELWEVTDEGELRHESVDNQAHLRTGRQFIRGLSGMTCVLPAWHIEEVLNMSALIERRDVANRVLTRESTHIPRPE